MININKEKELRVKELLKNQKADQKMANKINLLFYDSTLDKIKKKRNKQNAFNFIEQGSYEKKIEALRIKYTAKQLGLDLNSTQLTVLVIYLGRRRKRPIKTGYFIPIHKQTTYQIESYSYLN